jgi:hypothetical protein
VVLGIQLGTSKATTFGSNGFVVRCRRIASALLEQTIIPAIAAQQELLDEVAGDE